MEVDNAVVFKDRSLLMTEFTRCGIHFVADTSLVVVRVDSLPIMITDFTVLTSDCYEIDKRDYDEFLPNTRHRACYVYLRENSHYKLYIHPGQIVVKKNDSIRHRTLYLSQDQGLQDILDCSDYEEVNFVTVDSYADRDEDFY